MPSALLERREKQSQRHFFYLQVLNFHAQTLPVSYKLQHTAQTWTFVNLPQGPGWNVLAAVTLTW